MTITPQVFQEKPYQARPERIFIVGPMGAGKTTIGKSLANKIGYKFNDTDHEIIQRCGADIPWIFDIEGEEGFRRREHQVLDALTQQEKIVLATGGGCILSSENRELLSSRGVVIYVDVSIDEQLRRTSADKNRPLLQNDDPKGVLTRLRQERQELYAAVAHKRYEFHQMSTHRAASIIARGLGFKN